jgi:hypothetical protein
MKKNILKKKEKEVDIHGKPISTKVARCLLQSLPNSLIADLGLKM